MRCAKSGKLLKYRAYARQSDAVKKAPGAARGTRTPDPRITNAVLYRLSYRGAETGIFTRDICGKEQPAGATGRSYPTTKSFQYRMRYEYFN